MTKDVIDGILLFISLVVPLVGVFFFAVNDRFVDKKRKKIYIILTAAVASLILQNYLEYYLIEYVISVPARTIASVYGYSVRPLIITLFIYLISPDKKHIPANVLVLVNLFVYSTAFYSRLSISFSADNHFIGGPLRYSCLIVSAVLVIYNIVVVVLECRKEKRQTLIIPILLTALVIVGTLLDIGSYFPITHRVDYITITTVVVTVFYYIWLHIRLVYKYEEDLVLQQKIQVALSQIKPHFIYNTLNAIQDIDGMPEEAQNAIVDFSKFLRENLDFQNTSNLIPFNKELDHVTKYANLEKLRFRDKINVIFDIQASDFLIPYLSLQMVVENAIKHGITKKYDGGTVKISSFERDGKFFVVVEDDGVGFDVNKVIGDTHLGFKNARERLRHFVGGTIIVESEVGKGTKVTIIIPKVEGE